MKTAPPPVADSVAEYEAPSVAAASELVATEGGVPTTMLRLAVAVSASASVARTVKLSVPDALGVPEIAPAALRLSPAGRLPPVTAQV